MSEEARKAAVFSCEYSEQNPVYCQQCGGHEHLCKKPPLNAAGLTAYFDQMATGGRVETTVQWLVEISLLIQDDVEKRMKHAHAEHTAAIREKALALVAIYDVIQLGHPHNLEPAFDEVMTALKAALEE